MESENNTDDLDKKINLLQQEIIIIKANKSAEKQKIENKYLKEINNYNEKIKNTKEKYELIIKPKKDCSQKIEQDITMKVEALKYHEVSLNSYNTKIEKYESTLTEKRNNLQDTLTQKEYKAKELSVANETKRLIKSYTLQTFQETLDLIGEMASDTLSGIPNMNNSTIFFEGCKETKAGKIKDEVNAIITIEGEDKIPIKSLSGGERTAIDLVVDLAVIDIIESKAGKGADFFVIDEPFDGLDSVCKENCLEILKQVDTNKKIIMVDHSSELKEMISDVITVVKNGESSFII